MTNLQKRILIVLLIVESLIFNTTFCDWKSGRSHRFEVEHWSGQFPNHSRLIQSLGPFGVYGRDYQTIATDTVLGIAVPLAFIALALLICTGKRPDTPPTVSES